MGVVLIALLIPTMGASANGREHRDRFDFPRGGFDRPGGFGFDRCSDGDTIFGGRGSDYLPGTRCDDVIFGLSGNDTLIGNDGRDLLLGGFGNDRILARDGERDIVRGGRGYDRCVGDTFDVYTSCEAVAAG